jgi:hypothetical protein
MHDRSAQDGNDTPVGLDQMLRNRVANTVDQLLRTFDATLLKCTSENLEELRADADRAMRAIARVRLEAERLASLRD